MSFQFLYRQGEGQIDRLQWWRADAPIWIAGLVLSLIWLAIAPQARDLAHEPLFDLGVALRYFYLIVYAFALFLLGVMHYFVSAKRFARRGLPPAFAGLALFAIFIAAAAHWYQPRSEGTAPVWMIWLIDLAALGCVGWTVYQLGVARD